MQLFNPLLKTNCGQRAQIAKARELRAANDLLKRCQGAPCAGPSHHRSISARVRRPKSAPDNTAEARSTTQLTRAVEIAALHLPPDEYATPLWLEHRHRANQARTARAHICRCSKRPRSSARITTLSLNQHRRALTARLIILASQPGRQSTWVGD